jgi:hypothetical protein
VISPRIAIKAAKIIAQCGPDSLNFVADFSGKPDILKTSIAKFKSIFEINELITKLTDIKNNFDTAELTTLQDVKTAMAINKSMHSAITKLKAIKADDTLVQTTSEAVKAFTTVYETNKKKLDLLISIDELNG